MSFVERSLSGHRSADDYSGSVRHSCLVVCLGFVAIVLTGCGPTGPGDPAGTKADPVYLLSVLPTPAGLIDTQRERPADATQLVDAIIGSNDRDKATSVARSGVEEAAVRRWKSATPGTMVASVSVWPGHQVASNVAVTVGQTQLGQPGTSGWTPSQNPGSTGTRSSTGDRIRVLARAVGPNVFVVRATGGVSDDSVIRTMRRLIQVQGGVSS